MERALTVFLAGAECPFTCSFCDLWRWTIDGPTPPGALAKQLTAVLQSLDITSPLTEEKRTLCSSSVLSSYPTSSGSQSKGEGGRGKGEGSDRWPRRAGFFDHGPGRLKLYNASNFFDRRAVPAEDLSAIAALSAAFAGVTVESHANTVGPLALEFARQIPGRLEVAVGLETIHPTAAAQLNKRLDLARFDSAARFLSDNDLDLRVFVLLGAPYIPSAESVEWTVRTVEYAAQRGASVVSIIPVRGGNGELERLASLGHFTPPALSELEAALDGCLQFGPAVITADLWDVERLSACADCRSARIDRLRRLNVTGRAEAPIVCPVCDAR